MFPVPLEQQQLAEAAGSAVTPTASVLEGMTAAGDEALRASVGSSLGRWVKGMLDTSSQIDPHEANQMYGLEGTDAAFKDGQSITHEQAKAVAEDQNRIKLNEFIMDTVNRDAPVMGRVSQFAAGIVGSLMDPTTMAINIGGAALIGKGVGAVVSSARAMSAASKLSPSLASGLRAAYSTTLNKSIMTTLAREGAENFAGSIIEESVNVIGLGSERLARKVTLEESAINVVAGTVLGSMVSMGATKEGRAAISKAWGRRYGDRAAEVLKADIELSTLECTAGIKPTGFAAKQADNEIFNAKPWHLEEYKFTPGDGKAPGKMFLAIKEDGTPHLPNTATKGTVLTDNINHAMNSGTKIIEVDTSKTKLLSKSDILNTDSTPTITGVKLYKHMRISVMEGVSKEELSKAINAIKFPDSTVDTPRIANKNLEREIANLFDGKTVDEAVEIYSKIRQFTDTKNNVDEVVDAFTKANGYDGHTFVGTKSDGSGAYNGVSVRQDAAEKLVKTAERETPKPTPKQKAKHDAKISQEMLDYEAKIRQQAADSGYVILDEAPTSPEYKPAPNNPMKEAFTITTERKNAAEALLSDLERQIAESPESASPKKIKEAKLLRQMLEAEDMGPVISKEADAVTKYTNCMLGG